MTPGQPLTTRPVRLLFAFALALLLASQLALSYYAWTRAEERLLPALGSKAHTAALSLAAKLERALGYGIPLPRLVGVPEYFADVLRLNPDLAYVRVTGTDGEPLFGGGDDGGPPGGYLDQPLPLRLHGAIVGQLHVGVHRNYLAARVHELRYDIGIVLLASLLIAFEVLWFVVTLNFTAPMRQIAAMMTRLAAGDFRRAHLREGSEPLAVRLGAIAAAVNQGYEKLAGLATSARQTHTGAALLGQLQREYEFGDAAGDGELTQQRIVLVRVLSFLFMFAEMLSRPFLPVYAATLPMPGMALPDGLRASLPVTAFLLAVALSMPAAGHWSDRVGRRTSYVAGASLVIAGLAATALLPQYWVLLAARGVTGIGYALMFMACQGYVFDSTDNANRGRGMALFVGAIMVAEICAPAVGGILADRLGYRPVFALGAGIALVAAFIAGAVLDNRGAVTLAGQRAPLRELLHNRRFVALTVLSGIPAKFLYSGFLIFLVPVLLNELGLSKSDIGRYTMLYGLSCLLLAPLFAHLADRYNAYAAMVAGGGLLTALAMLPIMRGASADLVMLGIAGLGVGQAMSISAQLVLVTRTTRNATLDAGRGPVMGVFRLVERLGGAAGPIVTGVLLARYGAAKAMLILGAVGLLSSLLFTATLRPSRLRRPRRREELS
ncbi:MFS transporter [Rugamonas apoptosis]|uniref:MFS transporter n=1 Tax=Rugamonas apoptosis TaxID=2758570 RepID=A0A7W2IKF5_9BURK|nr:MFS transporter [Rugamonas apoptosis]MBA5687484.1 MFS transporter [Rugamonas apoptosis]